MPRAPFQSDKDDQKCKTDNTQRQANAVRDAIRDFLFTDLSRRRAAFFVLLLAAAIGLRPSRPLNSFFCFPVRLAYHSARRKG